MDMYVNGEYKMVDLGYVKEIKQTSVVFIVDHGEVEINVDAITKDAVVTIYQANDEALIPLDVEEKFVVLDGEPV
ncbi:hypothetical protein P5G51_019325 [Virgibacillus sp. 179-BFC.A HS]|uniref:Uncharacterized protein n=1 Tax=Tigheibacillus jepli TaxID=3035914 RepID=A0ABU5CLE7_9BACI|nr:hypothetical protein [Virgibacillus sp. 179-BFC.A HS]MDY0407194.1 hypothetical protein [Virgibacillus sp. 179-BFC.A HS]